MTDAWQIELKVLDESGDIGVRSLLVLVFFLIELVRLNNNVLPLCLRSRTEAPLQTEIFHPLPYHKKNFDLSHLY